MGAHELFGSPAAGFDEPVAMLGACHWRIEQRCALVERLVEHLSRLGSDDDAKRTSGALIHYFDTSVNDHHEDEEADLFPLLLEVAAPAERAVIDVLVAELLAQHADLRQAWSALRADLQDVVSGERQWLDAVNATRFLNLLRMHVAREDAELLPVAARLLQPAHLETLGRRMAARRGVEWPLAKV